MLNKEIHENFNTQAPNLISIYPQGWRGTIGFIIPSGNLTSQPEHEFRYLLPEGVGVICQRLLFPYHKMPLHDALQEMQNYLPDAANVLSTCGVNMISFGCTSSSFIRGREHEVYLAKGIEKASGGLPVVTVASAVADAIRFLGAKKLLVISPYTEEVNKRLDKYLREDQNIGLHFVKEIVEQDRSKSPWQQSGVVLDAYQSAPPGADAIFFSCGGTRLAEVIPMLEAETGVPVLSTNLCNVWRCLQVLGIRASIQGKGKLLELRR